jgi:copper chaperone CopZ
MTYRFNISGIACKGCVSAIQKALEEIEGIETVIVTMTPPQAEITSDRRIEKEEINKVLIKAGKYKTE